MQRVGETQAARVESVVTYRGSQLGLCCNGRGRGSNNASYDFELGDRRVAIKSSRLQWVPHVRYWQVRFYKVKMHSTMFDDLYLVVLSPSGLSLIKHDLATGIMSDGRRTETHGYRIIVYGTRDAAGWEKDVDMILLKLCRGGSCNLIARDSFGHPTLRDLLSTFKASRTPCQALWDGIPMSNMSSEKRGLRIQAMGFDVDQRLHPGGHFSLISEGLAGGGGRGSSMRPQTG